MLGYDPKNQSSTDLVGRMDRLSIKSDGSEFSIISDAPSVRSLDSNGSTAGGIVVCQDPGHVKHHKKEHDLLHTCDGSTGISVLEISLPDRTRALESKPYPTKPRSSPGKVSPFWHQFPKFIPDPSATFKDEFARLAKEQTWGTKVKRKYQIEALNAEVAFHYGTCLHKLDRWQELCEEVGIENVPTSITQCKKASSNLDSKFTLV